MTPKTLRAAAEKDVQPHQTDTTLPRAGASAGQRFVTRGGKALENSAAPRTSELLSSWLWRNGTWALSMSDTLRLIWLR